MISDQNVQLLNAGYGALASIYFLYYMVENAEAITLGGQFVNKLTTRNIDKKMKKMFNVSNSLHVAGDTDSGYFTIKPFMQTLPSDMNIQKKVDIADRFCKEVLSPLIEEESNFIANYFNCYEQKMIWGREVIAENAIWLAKKNYFMNVWDSEGVRFFDEPKFKMTGVEAVKASAFPEYARVALKSCYKKFLDQDNSAIIKIKDETREMFDGFPVEKMAIPTRVNGVMDYFDPVTRFKPGALPHLKGSINHNILLQELDLKKYEDIKDGASIKWVPLKLPNSRNIKEIAFDGDLPREFDLHEYVDKDALFDKAFLTPLRRVLNVVGYQEEEIVSLW